MRNPSIDCLRGFAILLITIYHAWRFVGYPTHSFFTIFDFYTPGKKGVIGVPIFVFISGFTMFLSIHSYKTTTEFIKSRLSKLIPKYYIAIAVWSILILLGLYGNRSSLKDIIFHLLFIHNLSPQTFYSISDPLWYIGMQVQLYILFALSKRFFNRYLIVVGFVAFSTMVAINYLINYGQFSVATVNLAHRGVLSYFFIFVLGYGYAKHEKILRSKMISATLIMLSLFLLFFNQYFFNIGRLGLFLDAILLSIAIAGLPLKITNSKYAFPLRFLSKYSYSIFLYNFIFMILPVKLNGIFGISAYTSFTIIFAILVEKGYAVLTNFVQRRTIPALTENISAVLAQTKDKFQSG